MRVSNYVSLANPPFIKADSAHQRRLWCGRLATAAFLNPRGGPYEVHT